MLQSSLRLTRINLKNFKAFDETSVSFPQKINLIMGENSSGKSSIIKSIIAMKQTFSVTNEYEVFAANGDYVELGIYGDYVHSHDDKKDITFGFEFHGEKHEQEMTRWWSSSHFDFEYDPEDSSELKEYERPLSSLMEITYDKDYKTSQARLKSIKIISHIKSYGQAHFHVERAKTRSHYYLKTDRSLVDWIIDNHEHIDIDKNKLSDFLLKNYLRIEKENRIDFQLMYPSPPFDSRSDTYELSSLSDELFDMFNESLKKMLSILDSNTYYLAPIRSSPLRSYKRSSHSKSIGISGAYTASVLANLQAAASRGSTIEREKLDKFNTWLNIIFPNTKVKAQTIDELVKIKLENNKLQSEDTITDVGFGFSQVLPILIQGALLNPNELLIIEQPELHLHPNAQFLFAQVLCSMANGGVQLLIETHSEHLLRGIQLEISKHRIHSSKGISHKDINIMYINKNKKDINYIQVNEYGEITSNWPSGFLDAAYNATMEIMKNKSVKVES